MRRTIVNKVSKTNEVNKKLFTPFTLLTSIRLLNNAIQGFQFFQKQIETLFCLFNFIA